jgi:UDP-glucuronate decarboxylase
MRIFNTYGPRMHENDGRVVSNFIVQALRGEPISIYGTGMQTRALCYVDDTVEAALKFMRTPANVTGPINVGNPVESTILDLAKKIIEMTGSSSEIVFDPPPQDDPKQRRPDISLAKSKLAWEPYIEIHEGLSRTIAYFQNQLRSSG